MGYRSDVLLAVAVEKKNADTFWAAYIIYPGVQETDVAKEWERVDRDDVVVFYTKQECIKWYREYPDVMALEAALTLARELDAEDNDFSATTEHMEIGEEGHDITSEILDSDSAPDILRMALLDMFILRREIEVMV